MQVKQNTIVIIKAIIINKQLSNTLNCDIFIEKQLRSGVKNIKWVQKTMRDSRPNIFTNLKWSIWKCLIIMINNNDPNNDNVKWQGKSCIVQWYLAVINGMSL